MGDKELAGAYGKAFPKSKGQKLPSRKDMISQLNRLQGTSPKKPKPSSAPVKRTPAKKRTRSSSSVSSKLKLLAGGTLQKDYRNIKEA